VYQEYPGVSVLAKFVPHDAFSFDDSVNKSEALYVVGYPALTSPSEADISLHPGPSDKKIPLVITLFGMISVCGAAWTIAIMVILKLFGH
jgi:hypothetical protein